MLSSLSSLVAEQDDAFFVPAPLVSPNSAVVTTLSTPTAGEDGISMAVVSGVGDIEAYGKAERGVLVNPARGLAGGRAWRRGAKRARVVFRDDTELRAVRLFSKDDEPIKVGGCPCAGARVVLFPWLLCCVGCVPSAVCCAWSWRRVPAGVCVVGSQSGQRD